MSTTGLDSNRPLEQLGKLSSLLADGEFNSEKGQQGKSAISVGELKNLLTSIEGSISDLEEQIASNQEEQKTLAAESRELKKEIRELSEKLTSEVSKLARSTKEL
jgi:peptidoglycan hydrolase CwlO-like protein